MDKKVCKLLIVFGVFVFAVLFLLPFAVEFSVALKNKQDVFHFPSSLIPNPVVFANFKEIWNIIPLGRIYANTYSVIALSTVLNFFVAVPAAYGLSCLEFPFKRVITSLAFIAQMFVPVLVVVPVFKMMSGLHLVDNKLSLIIVDTAFSTAFVTLLLKGFFDTVPREVEDAALIDGCSRFGAMVRIYMPLCMGGIVVAVVYNAINVNNEFLFANTLINSMDKNMMSVALFRLIKANPYESVTWNYVMAAAVYASVPIQIMFFFIRKHLTKGFTAGAIK